MFHEGEEGQKKKFFPQREYTPLNSPRQKVLTDMKKLIDLVRWLKKNGKSTKKKENGKW